MNVSKSQVVIRLEFGFLIDKNDPVFKLSGILDSLDHSKLRASYLRRWRKLDPAILFAVIVFAYMNGIYSSPKIEVAYTVTKSYYIYEDCGGCPSTYKSSVIGLLPDGLISYCS